MNQENLEKIFEEAFANFGDAIFRFCVVKVSNVELAEDMTQEAFTRYWQYLRAGKEVANTRALLYTIANNMAKDWYKKKKSDSLDAKMESGYLPTDQAVGPEAQASYQQVLDTIDDMEPVDKEVLVLTYVEGLPPKEIADIIEETANNVSVRLSRATKRLQQKLHI